VALEKTPSYHFGPFRLDPLARRLTRDGEGVPLTPRAFDTLVVLVERRGGVVTKDELLRAVWQDTFVEENNLNQAISALRRALHDDGNGNRFIETVPRKGYAFVVPVLTTIEPDLPTPSPAPRLVEAPAPLPLAAAPDPVERRSGTLLAVALVAACALAVGTFWLARPSTSAGALSRIQSVAVLPFRPIVLPREDEFLGLALADSVITRLSRASHLAVRPTSAIRDLPRQSADPAVAARALRVDAVLDGQIQEVGDRIRVTLQLVGVGSDVPLWSERFDAPRSNLFELEDSIADGVARGLSSGLEGAPASAPRRPPSPEAYESYLRARYYWNKRTDDANRKSQELFRQAIDADPGFAPAWAGLADAHNLVGQAPQAKAAAQKALELDPDLAQAHAALGNVALFYDHDLVSAERSFQRAILLDPSYATAHQWYAFGLAASRRFDEAVARIRKARDLDPLSLSIATDVGNVLFLAGRNAEAESEVRKALDMDPHFAQAHIMLGIIRFQEGDLASAEREAAAGGWSGARAVVEARAGHSEQALALLDSLPDRPERFRMWRAEVRLALGEPEAALDELEQAAAEHSGDVILLAADPRFASLRGNPRFGELLRRLRLPATAG